jgi:PAS domain S-box-containing protein
MPGELDDRPFASPDAALRDPDRLAAVRATGLMTGPPSEVLDRVARAAARMLDVPVALVSLVDDERQRFAGRAAERGPIVATRETPIAQSICQHVVARGAPVVIADAANDPRARDHPAVRDFGVRAYAGVPLTTPDGALLGALCAIDDAPHAWRSEDLARLGELATVAQAELAQRTSIAAAGPRDHTILEHAARSGSGGLWSWQLGDEVVFYSPRLRELLDYSEQEVPNTRAALRAVVHPDDLPRLRAAIWAHLERRTPFDLEVRARHKDGGWRWMWLRGQAEWDAAGQPMFMAGSASDVTGRRAAEAALLDSQARLALIFSRATVGLCELAPDGRFLRANAELCRIVGRTPEEMTRLSFADVTHPDDIVRSVDAVASVFASGGPARLEKRYLRPDGTAVVAESVVTLLDAEPGSEPTLLAVTVDLTARREAEAALRESEARFRQLADNVGEMFWLVELGPALADSRLLYVNPAYTRITGRPLDAVEPSPVLGMDQIAADDLPRVLEATRAVVAGESRTLEYRMSTAAGAHRVVRTRMFPVRGGAGGVARIAGLTEDVTDQRTLEERLHQAQKMEAVGKLAGGVAHDFNNLLTVVGAHLEFVRADLGPAHPAQEDLAGIAEAAGRARALVRQLLSFSRKQPVHPRPVHLGELVRGAERLLRRVVGEEIALAVHVDDGPLTVHADPGQLEQVLVNLAVNARDAMHTPRHGHPGSGGVLTIEVLPDASGAGVQLVVRDTGHGMTAEERERVFEPFFTTKAIGRGTGLGLAAVFGIVSQSGGAVTVDSAPGLGTTFVICLPATDAQAADGQAGDAAATSPTFGGRGSNGAGSERAGVGGPAANGPERGTTARPARPARPARATVLLVEDEPPVRSTTRRILERLGYAVIEAQSGADGLRVWDAQHAVIDAVVTDMRMPEVGGRALALRLREQRSGLPIVFMSGYAEESIEEGRGAPQAFVEKPFTADALRLALEAVLPPPAEDPAGA